MNYFSYGRNMDMQKIFLETFYNFGNKTRQVKNSTIQLKNIYDFYKSLYRNIFNALI